MSEPTERITTSATCPKCGEVAPVTGTAGETLGLECEFCGGGFEVTLR